MFTGKEPGIQLPRADVGEHGTPGGDFVTFLRPHRYCATVAQHDVFDAAPAPESTSMCLEARDEASVTLPDPPVGTGNPTVWRSIDINHP